MYRVSFPKRYLWKEHINNYDGQFWDVWKVQICCITRDNTQRNQFRNVEKSSSVKTRSEEFISSHFLSEQNIHFYQEKIVFIKLAITTFHSSGQVEGGIDLYGEKEESDSKHSSENTIFSVEFSVLRLRKRIILIFWL